MERFNALDIENSSSRDLVTAVFTYEDFFIDKGLRLYDFKQAFHLYLKQHGYQTIIFYNTAMGFGSFEKDMLETFLSPDTQTSGGESSPEVLESPQQVGRLSGSRLLERRRRRVPGADQIPDTPVPVSHPERNLYYDSTSQAWHVKGQGNRVANMSRMLYDLPRMRHLALVVEASEDEPEFDVSLLPKLVDTIRETQRKASLNPGDINDNRLIILVNSESCRSQIMKHFDPHAYPHPSVFMQGFFKSQFIYLPENSEYHILNFRHSFVLPSPTREDVKRILLRTRLDTGIEKKVEWGSLEDICDQFSMQDLITLKCLYNMMSLKEEYTCESFKQEGIVRRGDDEASLKDLIGLSGVKSRIEEIKNRIELAIERGEDLSTMNKHMVFYGNPGTGKTTVARIIAGIFKDLGLVSKGHLVEVTRENLVAGYVGQTAIKTSNVIDSALDGVLFVDEAYRLADGGENDFGKEAVDTILARMENDRDRLVVIFAGYEADMERLYKMNDGIPSRINTYIEFEDYNESELKEIFMKSARKKYIIPPEVESVIEAAIKYAMGYKSRSNDKDYKFGNARWVRNLMEKVENRVAARRKVSDITKLQVSDFAIHDMAELQGFDPEQANNGDSEPSYMDRLMSMVGLSRMKAEIQSMIGDVEAARRYAEAGIALQDKRGCSRHMVFSGNPGTGKTTVARLMGRIFYDLGLLNKGHVVEIENRGYLVAGYQGQTAQRVNEIVDSAKGGVLFIDEIYSLVQDPHDSFGHEALDTLMTRIENDRDDMVVILAGYDSLMKSFIGSNPGLLSRFNKYIHFDDYSAEELVQIVVLNLQEFRLHLDADAMDRMASYIREKRPQMSPDDGNGRWARNFADWIKSGHDQRIVAEHISERDELLRCTFDDVVAGIELFEANQLNRTSSNNHNNRIN